MGDPLATRAQDNNINIVPQEMYLILNISLSINTVWQLESRIFPVQLP